MIKSDVIEQLHKRIGGVSRQEISQYVKHVFDTIGDALAKDEVVKVTNFGVFQPRIKRARMGRNPKTLEAAIISERRVVTFRTSDALFKRLNAMHAARKSED